MAYVVSIISVVGDAFCVPYPVELIIKKKCRGLFEEHFEVLDVNGNLFLRVGGSCKNFQKKRTMRDPAGFPIITIPKKTVIAGQFIEEKVQTGLLPSSVYNDLMHFR
ncbi:unnamed protein product [Dovyalis caffra]|uniref:Uncharacterized protein n=1 Tax=Dovyalis caffra TaxID=77055 RepID=A0AAV1QMN6_9ROSI|nr:unnamed protein product [Dovyalis caffra]